MTDPTITRDTLLAMVDRMEFVSPICSYDPKNAGREKCVTRGDFANLRAFLTALPASEGREDARAGEPVAMGVVNKHGQLVTFNRVAEEASATAATYNQLPMAEVNAPYSVAPLYLHPAPAREEGAAPQDTVRLDWLQEHGTKTRNFGDDGEPDAWQVQIDYGPRGPVYADGTTLRLAIDSAIALRPYKKHTATMADAALSALVTPPPTEG